MKSLKGSEDPYISDLVFMYNDSPEKVIKQYGRELIIQAHVYLLNCNYNFYSTKKIDDL